jgi:hypothetical protein
VIGVDVAVAVHLDLAGYILTCSTAGIGYSKHPVNLQCAAAAHQHLDAVVL